MRWPKSHELTALVLAPCIAASVFSGCAENESPLFVEAVLFLDASCIAKAEGAATVLPNGVLDRALAESYRAALLIGNQLTRRGSRDQLRTETSRIALKGAVVELTDSSGKLLAPAFTSPGTGFVNPGAGEDPGLGAMFVDLIPAGAIKKDGLVIANISVFGTTLGGVDIDSSTLSFPIRVCTGCLINYPLEADDPASLEFDCTNRPDDAPEPAGCWVGQDAMLDCRRCAPSKAICRDPSSAAPTED